MSKSMALLQYLIMFDPSETGWTSGFEFEKKLNDFFQAQNMNTEILNADGNTGSRVIFVYSMDRFDKLNQSNPPADKTPEKPPVVGGK